MIIRKLELNDFENGLLETLSSLQEVNLTPESAKLVYNGYIADSNSHIYVVEDKGKVIACGTLLIEYKLIHSFCISIHLEDIAVHKDFQNMGYGKLLIDYLIKESKLINAYKITLDCSKELKSFYEKLDFLQSDVHMRLNI